MSDDPGGRMNRRDRSTWTLNMADDGQGFLFDGTEQAACVPGLDTTAAVDLVKTRDSAFVDTGLRQLLQDRGITGSVLAGVSTHTCVFQTASDAHAYDFRVVIARDATASHRPDLEDVTLGMLHDEYRQEALPTADLIPLVERR